MLVLARRANQSVMIGDDIEINVVEVKGEQVKLGFVAPRHVPVYRTEIYLEMKAANTEASKAAVEGLEAVKSTINLDALKKHKPKPKTD